MRMTVSSASANSACPRVARVWLDRELSTRRGGHIATPATIAGGDAGVSGQTDHGWARGGGRAQRAPRPRRVWWEFQFDVGFSYWRQHSDHVVNACEQHADRRRTSGLRSVLSGRWGERRPGYVGISVSEATTRPIHGMPEVPEQPMHDAV
jgi:hypothetical protein